MLLTATTREPGTASRRSSSSPVSAKWPRWLVPSCSSKPSSVRAVRADARRNRARVLEVAIEAFATEGLSLPVHEIARRAGVGTGTVSRHFPTKESLFEAIVFSFAERLVEQARQLAATEDPGTAFFGFFSAMVGEGAANRALADALARAQQAGAVRGDVDVADVKALMVGCLARERPGGDAHARDRMLAVVCEGLRADRREVRAHPS